MRDASLEAGAENRRLIVVRLRVFSEAPGSGGGFCRVANAQLSRRLTYVWMTLSRVIPSYSRLLPAY